MKKKTKEELKQEAAKNILVKEYGFDYSNISRYRRINNIDMVEMLRLVRKFMKPKPTKEDRIELREFISKSELSTELEERLTDKIQGYMY